MSDADVRWRGQKVIQDTSNRLVTDTQIKKWDNKTDPGHKHTKSDITDFPTSMPASDVKAWAKADNKPSYVWNEIGNKPTEFNPIVHRHLKQDITDFPDSIKNPLSIAIMLNGGNTEGKDLFTYDGSVSKTINITYANIGAAPKEHYHDDRYYTEEETDKLLKGVSTGVFESLTWDKILNKPSVFTPANHTHSKSEINDFPDSLKNPANIVIKLNGGTIEGNNMFTYDGSIVKTINITAPDIGASSIGHLHTVKDIKDFPTSMPASDVFDWAKEKFKPSYVWSEIGEKPTEFNPVAHKHVISEITDFPTTMKNPYSISIRLNNGTTEDLDLFTYNGDGEKSINITPIKINAADRVHTHTRSQITDFPETLRNPAFLTIKMDNMANKSSTSDSYDGSNAKTITVASNTHKHLKQDILDFPDSIKNPKNITLILDNGETTTQDFYDGSEAKTFEVAAAKHTHSKSEFTDFPVSIKNPFSVTIVTNDGKTTASDSYDGSKAKTFNLASAKHVHVKSEITDFPDSIKNPAAVTIVTNNGETTSKDTYDGSASKTFELATAKHVHVKSEITDFPASIKNPTAITITMNDGTDITKDSYDGSEAKTFDVAKGQHVHVKSEITDFPDSIKNPTSVTIITSDGKDVKQDSYDGSASKTFELATAKHVHVKSEITDFPTSIKNPTAITISLNDGKTTTTDSYDGSKEKSFSAASAKHVHTKSEITDFPTSIKNPASITIAVDDGRTKTQDSYDGSSAKTFDVANAKHVHTKSDITDFPTSIKNPNTLIVNINDGKTATQSKYDGSVITTINVASSKHVHTKSEITDFPSSMKNPNAINIAMYNGTNTTTDSYDGSATKTFNVASSSHTHLKSHIVDFPDSIKNPTNIIINVSDGKTTTQTTYDGSEEKTLSLASSKHVHTKSEITDFPSSIKNPTSLSIQLNGGAATVYDGSTAKSINITPAGIGASANTHLHDDRYYTESEIDTKLSSINTTLTSHNHTKLQATASTTAVPGKSSNGFMTYHYNVNTGLANNMPSTNNANAILTISRHDGDYTTQLGFSSNDNIYYRNGVGSTAWKRLLDSSNYNDYAPTKTGSGASGTWGINISGKANTAGVADSANAVAWGNVSGKPSTYPATAHTHTKSQITDFPASIKNPTSIVIKLNGGTSEGTNQFTYDGSTAKSINITPAGIGASASNHTHNYAGSGSVGGSANSAVKLDTATAGSATQPVYFTGGKPVACTYTLSKSVPSDAKFTDTNTWRGIQNNLTSDSTSDSLSAAQGKVLKGLVDGKAASGHTHTTVVGSYTGNGGQQKPNYFGTNKVGFLMMNTTVNGNSQYKDWIIMDCYSGSDVGGGVAIGVNRQSLGAYIMRSDAARTAWSQSAELLHTGNYTSYTVTKTGSGASGTWGINISGKATTAGTADSANAVAWGNVSGKPSTYTPSSHTHNYAGSGSAGGSANSAVKLDTATAGSATQPVYFTGGKPVACTYTLGKSVPSNAVFTDTNTWRGIQNNLTSDSTSDSLSAAQGKVLKGLVDGKAASSHTHTIAQITNLQTTLNGKAASSHTHNYAGSGSAGGSANSAVKLDTATAGSATQPVYFTGGKPAACTYTLGKSVPSDAKFTDTNTWRGIQNNLTSDSTSDSLSAAQGKVLKGLVDGKAASNHNHDSTYLKLSGGTTTGRITRSSGGAWISQRDYATVYQSHVDSSAANPVAAVKTPNGAWAIGSVAGTNNLAFSYSTDTNYNAGNNSANVIYLPAEKNGTIALTSDIPTWDSIKPTTTGFGGIALDNNGAYIYGENNSGNIFFRYKAYSSATDYSWSNLNSLVSMASGNHTHASLSMSKYDASLAGLNTNNATITFSGGTAWYIGKGPNSLNFTNAYNSSQFRMQNNYCYCDVGFVSMGIYNATATSPANMFINNSGFIYRTSSASKYKLNIENLNKANDYSYNILKLNPKQWFDKEETERYAKYLTAEYTKEKLDEEFEQLCLSSNITPCYGLIAEDVKEAGLGEFCEYGKEDNDGNRQLEGVQYERLPILMIPILRDLVSCMNKILPYAKKGIDDENTLKEVEEIEKRFNSFKEEDIINTKYDPETSKIIK